MSSFSKHSLSTYCVPGCVPATWRRMSEMEGVCLTICCRPLRPVLTPPPSLLRKLQAAPPHLPSTYSPLQAPPPGACGPFPEDNGNEF